MGASVAGSKELAKETLPTPHFYFTDFELSNKEINKNLTEYNETHFLGIPEFGKAAEQIQGSMSQNFVEFLERSCTAESSGFLLYKELRRKLKTDRTAARIFPAVIDVENLKLEAKRHQMVEYIQKPKHLRTPAEALAGLVKEIADAFSFMSPIDSGSVDN